MDRVEGLWGFITNRYRVIGYGQTFPGTATLIRTNENVSLVPQSITYQGVTNLKNWALNNYTGVQGGWANGTKLHRTAHLEGKLPAGGNVGRLDGRVQWRNFNAMLPRTEVSSGSPIFWW